MSKYWESNYWVTNPAIEVLPPDAVDAPKAGTFLRLVDPLLWQDAYGSMHAVPAGYVWNGASIPRLFWLPTNHPLRNRYLRSSCLHDYGCHLREEPSSVVHRRFYHGLRADGVSWLTAQVMWRAVQIGGPRW